MAAVLGLPVIRGRFTIEVAAGRQLSERDRSGLISLCTRAFADDFSNLFARRPNARHVVIRIDNRIVGHGCWEPLPVSISSVTSISAWISAVAVEPTLRRSGIGTGIMSAIESDCERMQLGLLSAAEPAFYVRLGWRRWMGPVERPGANQTEPVMFKAYSGGLHFTGSETLQAQSRSRHIPSHSTTC